jgi:hypothetical protein
MNSDFGVPNMNGGFGILNEDEVLFVRAGRVLMSNPTFKVSEFLDALAQLISENEDEWSEDQEGWFGDRGARCEVLRLGNQGWQRGRVRVRLEFCPEQPPKLLRESRTPREEVYSEDAYRQEKGRRRGSREDVYGRPSPQWEDDRPIYPEIDQGY